MMIDMSRALSIVLAVIYLAAAAVVRFRRPLAKVRREILLLEPFMLVLERVKLSVRFPMIQEQILWRISQIDGLEHAEQCARHRMGILLALMFGSLFAGTGASWLDTGTSVYFYLGIGIMAFLPVLWFRDLESKMKKIRRQVQLDFQPFVNRVALLVNAGDTLQHAVIRSIEDIRHVRDPLRREFLWMENAMRNHEPFALVIEQFSRRNRHPEIARFCTTVLVHYRRGGEECSAALREIARQMWDSRMALTRKMAEEASAKLTFPLVFLFVLVMIIAAVPAVMMMP